MTTAPAMNPTFDFDSEHEAVFGRCDEVHLGFEDHGIYTVHLGFDMGGSHHGTGHLMLTHRDPETGEHVVNERVARFIIRTMQCLGDWAGIKGSECLVLYRKGDHGRVAGVAPLPTRKGRPFIFADVLDRSA